MKIAKYIILLILLSAGTLSVFVATKDGSYVIERTKLIDVQKDIVYKYVTDTQNWDSINPWKKEVWKINSTDTLDNETLIQNITINGIANELTLTIKDTLRKKTILSWTTKGSLTFKDKFLSIIGRGVKNDFADKFDEGLSRINTILTREVNTFDIKIDVLLKEILFFTFKKWLQQKQKKFHKESNFMFQNLEHLL